GSREDYERLSHFHYRDSRVPVPHRFFAMERGGELIGVIAYCYPPVNSAGRKKAVGYRPRLSELNRDWTIISRVVVHPKYRTIGLGVRLVKETLPLCGRRHVELMAVMAQYNPFAERAGMKLVLRREPHPSVVKAVNGLQELGFNPPLMSSESYNRRRLKDLSDEEMERLREILLGVSTQYYKRLSSSGRAYVRKDEFREWMHEVPRERLGRSLAILSVLNQSKAYLYWSRDWLEEED
ncbi:MAG TPA: GNAT family N-acetyltransferase, partial [Patescibacteria group bacterium]|nr:GNAT family N-acetyltransferase [Patescibacteria group bacterium]